MGRDIPYNERTIENAYASPFIIGAGKWKDFNRNRAGLFASHVNYMLLRLLGMFEYEGLPETLKAETIEKNILRFGYCVITDVPHKEEYRGGGIYCLPGTLSGEYNADLLPTQAVVTSSWLRYSSSQLEIDKDCVVIRNDPFYLGVVPVLARYGSQLADADLTLRLQLVNMRTNVLYHANDDSAKEDARMYLNKIQEGELGIIGGNSFFDGIDFDTKDASPKVGASIKDTLEAMQWLSAHAFIEFGLNDNYNMKREAINSTETDANADTLLPLVELMLKEREQGVKRLNDLYGLNVSVKLSGAWKRVMKDTELNEEAKEVSVEQLESDAATEVEPEQPEEQKPEESEE